MLSVTYKPFVLSVIMLNVIMLSVTYKPFVLSVIMLSWRRFIAIVSHFHWLRQT
jgi:hypothetical protein